MLGKLTNALLLASIAVVAAGAIYVRFFYRPTVSPEYLSQLQLHARERLSANATTIETNSTICNRRLRPFCNVLSFDKCERIILAMRKP